MAWFLSGPLYIPIMTFVCMTPITRKVDWLIWTVLPTTSCVAEEVLGELVAQEDHPALLVAGRGRSGSGRRPGGCWLRISPKSGSTPRMRAFTVLVPTVRPRRRAYSRLIESDLGHAGPQQVGVLVAEARRGGPRAGPCRPGSWPPARAPPMPSPMPRVLLWNERFKPSPKESSSTMERVPQAMASTVRAMRLRWRAASCAKSRKTRASSARSSFMRASGRPRGRAATPGGRGSSRPRGR